MSQTAFELYWHTGMLCKLCTRCEQPLTPCISSTIWAPCSDYQQHRLLATLDARECVDLGSQQRIPGSGIVKLLSACTMPNMKLDSIQIDGASCVAGNAPQHSSVQAQQPDGHCVGLSSQR